MGPPIPQRHIATHVELMRHVILLSNSHCFIKWTQHYSTS